MGRTYKDTKAFKERIKKEKESSNKVISKDKSKKHKRNYYEQEPE